MTDVLFYQNYTPVADVSTIAICIIYGCLLRSTYTMRQRNLTLFKLGNSLVFLAAVSSIAFHYVMDALSESNKLLAYALRDISYIALIFTYVVFCIYISNFVDMTEKAKRIANVCIWGVFAAFVIAEVTSPLTKWGFYIDGELQVHQNYYLDVFRFAYVYYTLVMVVILAVYRRKFITKMFRCLRNVMIVSFLVMVLEAELLTTSYTCMTFAFPFMAALFLFHYNSYDRDTGTLDSRAFGSYIKDLGGRKFSMIFMYLEDMNFEKLRGMSDEFLCFNEKYFDASCTFRLRDDKLVLVYADDKNRREKEQREALVCDFEKFCDRAQIGYRLVVIHSDDGLTHSREYLALDEFIEERLPLNTIYECVRKDVEDYRKSAYILSELRNIHQKGDLDDARVKVYCQPVLNTVTNTFTSAEALMRLELPETGMVFPDQFIPLAEKHEYIHSLSRIILNKTCRQIKELEKNGYQIDRISVNFSIVELRNRNFCEDIMEIIRDNEIPFEKIAVELTESRNEKEFENVKNIITSLQELGIKFYLDDFGTGYSNFERIIGLPIDVIKFDRSLTILAGKNDEARFMVGSFSDIFKKSNYQILFEGVEDERDENQCRNMNALYLQGFKYSKPIPIEQLAGFLKKAG